MAYTLQLLLLEFIFTHLPSVPPLLSPSFLPSLLPSLFPSLPLHLSLCPSLLPSLFPSLLPSFPPPSPGESHSSSYSHQQVLQLIKSRSKEQRLGILLAGQSRKDHIFVGMQVNVYTHAHTHAHTHTHTYTHTHTHTHIHTHTHTPFAHILLCLSVGQRAILPTGSANSEPHEGWNWNGTRLSLHLCGNLEHGYRTHSHHCGHVI